MKYFSLTLALAAASVGVVSAQDFMNMDAQLIGSYPIGTPIVINGTQVTVEYDNTNFLTGQYASPGGSADVGGNQITRMMMDDFTTLTGTGTVSNMFFSVVNPGTTVVTSRPRVRWWQSDGTPAGNPGTYIASGFGFTFNPITYQPNTINLYFGTISANAMPMPAGTHWEGWTNDDNLHTTLATPAEMDALGQAIAGPVSIGSSDPAKGFITNAAGSFFGVNNPAGVVFNFTNAPANFWMGLERVEDTNIVAGNVTLGDFVNTDLTFEYVRVTFTNGTGSHTFGTYIDPATGAFTVQGPPADGDWDVKIQGRTWLAATVGTVNIQFLGGGTVVGTGTLKNGDCDGDNEVTLADFGILSAAFGAVVGDANWNLQADLDRDNEVTLADFGILSANFGEVGE